MQLPMPDDWDGQRTCVWAVCWPDSVLWKGVLQGLIEQPMQGRQWDFGTGNFVNLRENFRPIYDSNFDLRGCLVSCGQGDFDRLIDALEGIKLSVSAGASGDCCFGGGGNRPPSPPGEEDDPPPPGFEQPEGEGGPVFPGDPEYQERKCKVFNLIHDQNVAIVEKVVASGFLTFLAETYGSLLTTVQLAVWTYLIGELSTPWPLVDGILAVAIGWSSGVFNKLLGETDVDALLDALNENQEKLVCAMYRSTSALGATNDYLQVLADAGVSTGNREIVLAIMIPRLVNLAFFKDEFDEAIETAIGAYTGAVDCDECSDCPVLYDDTSSWVNWDSEDASSGAGMSVGDITNKLHYQLIIASSPSGAAVAQRRFIAPLTEIYAEGWVPEIGASIRATIDGDGPVVVGHGIAVTYVTDPPQQTNLVLANATGETTLILNSNDDIASIKFYAANSRASGSGTLNNSGQYIRVEFCNA